MTLGLKCEKQKDVEMFENISLQLAKVALEGGRDSCVIEPFDPKGAFPAGQDATAKKLLAVLKEKFGPEGATATEWQQACYADAGITRETFYRRRSKLEDGGLVEKHGDGQGARYRPAKSKPVSVSD